MTVQLNIRDVPEEARDDLATAARAAGVSMQKYLLDLVLAEAKRAHNRALVDRAEPAQPLLSFAEIGPDREVWEYAALVTSLDSEILTLGQLYRDRGQVQLERGDFASALRDCTTALTLDPGDAQAATEAVMEAIVALLPPEARRAVEPTAEEVARAMPPGAPLDAVAPA